MIIKYHLEHSLWKYLLVHITMLQSTKMVIYTLGDESKELINNDLTKKRWKYLDVKWIKSKENCLGHPSFNDFNSPVRLEEFENKQVLDVACGHHFTVVIAINSKKDEGYKNLKEFKLNIFKNAT